MEGKRGRPRQKFMDWMMEDGYGKPGGRLSEEEEFRRNYILIYYDIAPSSAVPGATLQMATITIIVTETQQQSFSRC